MAIQDQLNSKIRITTGDGKIYSPLSMTDSNTKSYAFNVSEFEFPEVEGTKVDRRLRKGTRYPLEFYFIGDNNVDIANEFEQSSRDPRPWTILHPVFGQFIAHPLSIEYDHSGIITTKINCEVVETITDDGPRVTNDIKGNVQASVLRSQEANNAFTAVVQPTVTDVNQMGTNADNLYNEAKSQINDSATGAEYFNLYTVATNKINNALNEFNSGVTFIQDFINYPAKFAIELKSRFIILKNQALKLSETLDNLNYPSSKKIFESQKGAIVSSAVEATTTPLENDYQSANDVIFIIEELLDLYNTFIDELNELQTPNGTEEDSYLPDADFMYNLNYAVNYAVSNLFQIALTAQQERIVYLDADSNVIIEAHKFYGLAPDDSTIQRFIQTNNIQLTELLQLKKGRKVIFYV